MLWEIWGDNRSFKTGINALLAWVDYNKGRTIYCNCPQDYMGKYHCILNFPHQHLRPQDYFTKDLWNATVVTDEGVEFMDSSHVDQAVRDASYFGMQATKRDVDWRYDTVRHQNIYIRVRKNAHFYIHTIRIPPDPRQPLQAVKVRVTSRYSSIPRTMYIVKPQVFFPLFNSVVLVPPPKDSPQARPSIETIHHQLVGP